MSSTPVVLRNQIKLERTRHDLTQEQLAELVGVTHKTINTVENGRFVPSTILALKLARCTPASTSCSSSTSPARSGGPVGVGRGAAPYHSAGDRLRRS